MAISVSTWGDLIDVLRDRSGKVVWNGPSYLERVTIDISDKMLVPAIESEIDTIDFNGLTIGNVYTEGAAKDFSPSTQYQYSEYDVWANGFIGTKLDTSGSLNLDKGIKNLTINHLWLEHPRDIPVVAKVFTNVYIYDIYSESVDEWSKWLRGSGKSGYNVHNIRANSAYLVRTSRRYTFGTDEEYMHSELCYFINCICNIRTKNAGITFPTGYYYNCELNLDYTFDWDVSAKSHLYGTTDEWDFLEIFPRSGYCFYNSYVSAQLHFDSEWAIKMCNTVLVSYNGHDCFLPTVNYTYQTIYNFFTEKDPNFGGIYELGDYFFGTNETYTPFNIIPGSGALRFNNVFITNNGDIRWQTMPEIITETIGDMRNVDTLIDHDMPVISDDDYRHDQYNDYSDYLSGDYIRRIYPTTNSGLPFLPLWYYPLHEEPSGGGSTSGYYISIYDMNTEQNEFDNNGVILHPTRCRVTEELNAGYNLLLEHPKDAEGKWQYILEMNIIKCLGQLFIIRKVTAKTKANSTVYTAYAEHISYHLNDYWLFPYPDSNIAGYHGQTLINSILAQMSDGYDNNQVRYHFDIKTNVDADPSFREWYEMPEGHTPYEMILGTNGFTYLIGGELYRDNFNISIYNRMENAQNDAFTIHPDLNLMSIERTVDLSSFCSDFRGYDQYGGWFEQSWAYNSLGVRFPHHVVRSGKFTYPEDYYSWTQFCIDVGKYFNKFCAPLVSYKIQVQDLRRHPDYKDFVNNYRFKVGDIGKVWDDESGKYLDLEITKTVKDGITGDTLEVVIGSQRSFTRPNGGINTTASRNYRSIDGASYDASGLTITLQPQDCAEPKDAVHTFSVRAESGIPVRYQWQYNNGYSDMWLDVQNGIQRDLVVTVASENMSGYKYRCIVSNAVHTIISNAALLSVIDVNDWVYEIVENSARILSYTGSQSELIIPDSLGGYPVKIIAATAFTNNETITRITIPDGVEVIE